MEELVKKEEKRLPLFTLALILLGIILIAVGEIVRNSNSDPIALYIIWSGLVLMAIGGMIYFRPKSLR